MIIPPMSNHETSGFSSLIPRREKGTKSTWAVTKSVWVSSIWNQISNSERSQVTVHTNLVGRFGH